MASEAQAGEHGGFGALLRELMTPPKDSPLSKVGQEVLGAVLQELAIAAPEGCLRAELLDRVGPGNGSTYSAATLSKALAALDDAQLISKRASYAGPNGGRPPERYMLGSQRWAMVGVHISISQNRPSKVTCTIRDLSAQLIHSESLELTEFENLELSGEPEWTHVGTKVAAFVNRMNRTWQQGRPGGRILGVGVEVPGHVHQGKVLQAPHAGYLLPPPEMGTPLASHISDALDKKLTVILDNDVNLIALRETYRPDGRTRAPDGVVVAVFDEGVGAGILVDGRVHRGHTGAAGEPGHIPVFVGPGEPRHPRETVTRTTPSGVSPTFLDPCNCGKPDHIDCYAIPERIAGELGHPLSEFATLAASPGYAANGHLTPEGRAFWTAGAALGYGLVALLHAHNPGWLLLMLPSALAEVDLAAADMKAGTAATLYRLAVETVIDEHAFSSTAPDARRGDRYLEVRAISADPEVGPEKAARNAAVRVLDEFIAHALKRDDCFREARLEVVPVPLAQADDRQLSKERLLAFEKDLRAILKHYDPENLIGDGGPADEYRTEEAGLSRLVMDARLDSASVHALWSRAFSNSKLLADEGKLSDFTRELVTLQSRWSSGRIATPSR